MRKIIIIIKINFRATFSFFFFANALIGEKYEYLRIIKDISRILSNTDLKKGLELISVLFVNDF